MLKYADDFSKMLHHVDIVKNWIEAYYKLIESVWSFAINEGDCETLEGFKSELSQVYEEINEELDLYECPMSNKMFILCSAYNDRMCAEVDYNISLQFFKKEVSNENK